MGEPVKIYDLAYNLIKLSGFEPNLDINIEITGLRPGEKLYEELLMSEEGLTETKHKKIFIGKPNDFDFDYISNKISELIELSIYGSVEEIKNKSIGSERPIYIFKLTDEEDFKLFLEDAEKYNESHKLTDLLLGYGYLENSCRFLNPSGCSSDKVPRLKIDNDGGIHTCDLKVKASSKIGDSLFEIEHNSMTQRAKKLNSRGCYECPTRIWCAKCSELPEFMDNEYCEIMKKKTYVLDYVMAPFIVIRLKDTNKNYRNTSIDKIMVSNEYMYNYISKDLKGEAAPYLPKFTCILSIDGNCLLWSPSTNKYYKISIQFAYVVELLLRRVKAESINKLLSEMLNIDEERSKKIVDVVLNTLKTAGVLYREVK